MPVETLTSVPAQITAGDTVILSLRYADFPVSTWNLDFVLSRNATALKTVRATVSGSAYLLTLHGADTAGIAPGFAQWTALVTEASSGQRTQAESGVITIKPNPSGQLAETDLQRRLREAQAEMDRIARSPSMVGLDKTQTVQRSLKDQRELVRELQAAVWREARGMGIEAPGAARAIHPEFI